MPDPEQWVINRTAKWYDFGGAHDAGCYYEQHQFGSECAAVINATDVI